MVTIKRGEVYVIDSSVLARAFFVNSHTELVVHLLEMSGRKEIVLVAPFLIWYELLSVFIKLSETEQEAIDKVRVISDLSKNGTIRILNENLGVFEKATEISTTRGKDGSYVSSYDATFHALAILENATFLTADKKHYHKTKDSIGHIVLLEYFTLN